MYSDPLDYRHTESHELSGVFCTILSGLRGREENFGVVFGNEELGFDAAMGFVMDFSNELFSCSDFYLKNGKDVEK
jgi:hypothetical protein